SQILDREEVRQGGEDVAAAAGVHREGELRLDVAKGNAHVVALAADLGGDIALLGPKQILRAGQLDLAALADVVADVVLERREDRGRENVHAEEAEILPARQSRSAEVLLRVFDRRLLLDRADLVDVGTRGDALPGERP